MYKKFYTHFVEANPYVQHYAAHSHHYWPDVTLDATIQYWKDSAKLVDSKWDYFFSTKIPSTQALIAEVLNLSKLEQIVFAPNTHELVYRVLSCFTHLPQVRVLTTDSEFHSFERQINRLSEGGRFVADKVSTLEAETFEDRFIEKIKSEKYDLIFFSQVFFNSGITVNIDRIVKAVENINTVIVIDGYHGFMALPTDLSNIENRVFYISGSYKYAQGGEGACFMHVPADCKLRPEYTGWFASFDELAKREAEVKYSEDGLRFAGSTMDLTPIYRLEAVLELFKRENIKVADIHAYVQKLQKNFLTALAELKHPHLCEANILRNDFKNHGHFFAFELGATRLAMDVHEELNRKGIVTDYRGSRLRFGFGLYQDEKINFKN